MATTAETARHGVLLLGGLQKGLLVEEGLVGVLGQLLLNGLDLLDEQLHGVAGGGGDGLGGDQVVKVVGVGLGQVQGQLGTGRADELVEDAGGQNDGLQGPTRLPPPGSGPPGRPGRWPPPPGG